MPYDGVGLGKLVRFRMHLYFLPRLLRETCSHFTIISHSTNGTALFEKQLKPEVDCVCWIADCNLLPILYKVL